MVVVDSSVWIDHFNGRDTPGTRGLTALLRDGEARLVLVAGEGGIGKTRVVAELAAGADDVTVLYGRCDEEELVPEEPRRASAAG